MLAYADKTHTVDLGVADTVQDVKAMVEARQGTQRILFVSQPSWCLLQQKTGTCLSWLSGVQAFHAASRGSCSLGGS